MPPGGHKWDRRIDRARELAEAYPFSAQILSFYSKLIAFQKTSYLQFQSASGLRGRQSGLGPPALDEVDLSLLLTGWSPFLSLIAREAPPSLAEFARVKKARGPAASTGFLRSVWTENRPAAAGEYRVSRLNPSTQPPNLNDFERFCAQAFLQPYAEFLADRADVPAPPLRRPVCPYCGSPPLVGVLRPEGDGAKRSLVCSFCRIEWDYLRIACPACEERREEKLSVYTTLAFDGVRVEACDTCRAYIKTIDLTRNGLAVPEVDELAAVPLTLWADEKGYQKVARNIIGL